jgi:hypothetical protein
MLVSRKGANGKAEGRPCIPPREVAICRGIPARLRPDRPYGVTRDPKVLSTDGSTASPSTTRHSPFIGGTRQSSTHKQLRSERLWPPISSLLRAALVGRQSRQHTLAASPPLTEPGRSWVKFFSGSYRRRTAPVPESRIRELWSTLIGPLVVPAADVLYQVAQANSRSAIFKARRALISVIAFPRSAGRLPKRHSSSTTGSRRCSSGEAAGMPT